jgi:hypothetical protein
MLDIRVSRREDNDTAPIQTGGVPPDECKLQG